jgi:hypothetical protein
MICVSPDTTIGLKMNSLSINTIINQEQDSELTTYKILGTLKEYLSDIRKYKIYPALSELVCLAVRLENLKKSVAKQRNSNNDLFILDEGISTIGELQPDENFSEETNDSSDYLDWVISQINPILAEGIAVYDYADQNMELKLINGDPLNNQEGYLVIPDNQTSVFNIYRFNCQAYKAVNHPERSIKTEFIQSIPGNIDNGIRIQYRTLLNNIVNNNLPVYICETDLDFPYEETTFQIARKKLLSKLSS